MKIICEREPFLAAFQTAATVAPARSPKSIIRNVKLDVTTAGLVLMATDMELGIRIEVSGIETEEPRAVVVPVAQFGSMLRESTDEKLHIESDAQGTVVRGERSEGGAGSIQEREGGQGTG